MSTTTERSPAAIDLHELTKVYGDGTLAVDGLNLEIAAGEFLVFVGPSGCGKTSALRMIAGLEEVTSGEVRMGGTVVNDVSSKNRDMAMVFQNYALYPHMSVADNMGFGLRMRGLPKQEIATRVDEAAGILGLTELLARRPRQLSGGQRQRVAMGRAIVRNAAAFLMDEPLSNLDAKLRIQMRAEIARIQRDLGTTTIYVTHDQSEAMTLGDRVCVLRRGKLQQVDTPKALYERPANLFVGSFIGSPGMNVIEASIVEDDDGVLVRFGSQQLRVPPAVLAARPALRGYAGRPIALGIRPEDISAATEADGERIEAVVDIAEDLGHEVFLHFTLDGTPIVVDQIREASSDAGDVVAIQPQTSGTPFVARVARGTAAAERSSIQLAVDTTCLHFFELEHGRNIFETVW